MEERHRDSRLRNWEHQFSNDFKRIENLIDAIPVVEKGTQENFCSVCLIYCNIMMSRALRCCIFFDLFSDATYISLTELSNKINEWEYKYINYDSEHKTGVFHDFQDFKTKLLIQLDSIEISSIPKIKTDRSILHDQIEKLSKSFDQKIHRGHHSCPICVQVKEVSINI